jgi:hypothetical protein
MDGVQRAQARGNHVRAALARARVESPAAGAPLLEPLLAQLAATLELDVENRQRWATLLSRLLPGAVAHGRRWRERLTPEAGALWDLQRLAVDGVPRHRARSGRLAAFRWSAPHGPPARPARDAVRWCSGSAPWRGGSTGRGTTRRPRRRSPTPSSTPPSAAGSGSAPPARDRVDAALEGAGYHTGARRSAPRAARSRSAARRRARARDGRVRDLRDAIAHDQLKLADVAGLRELAFGDPLLRADKALAELLDGVYYQGEFYLRGLHRLQALLFGTRTGAGQSALALAPRRQPAGDRSSSVPAGAVRAQPGWSRLLLALGLALASGY